MDNKNTVLLCDLPSDPLLLVKDMDRLIAEGRYVRIDNEIYDEMPKNIRFSTSERERYILESYLSELMHIPKMDYGDINHTFRSGSESERMRARDSALHIVPEIVELYVSPVNMDVIQVGNAELLDAAEEYNTEKHDFDFTSFAAAKVRRGILRFLNEQHSIRCSDRQIEAASERAAETYRRLTEENGIPPTAEELAEQAEIDIGFAHVICEQLSNNG